MNCAYPADKPKREALMSTEHALVASTVVIPEIGRFLLIRHGDEFCAIKFTGAWRGNDSTKPTMFNSGEESFRAEYDWYYTPTHPVQWNTAAVRSGHAEVRRGALKGIGRLAFQAVNGDIECGPMRFSWHAPTSIAFSEGPKQGDYGYEMALTKWHSVNEIKPDAPYLKWYRYDETRPQQVIKTDSLW
jgi:hypothetical protein